jgi:hypothetical protein
MADSVLKLKIDDREYNNKLRDAAKGMKALEAELRDAGKSFSDVDAKVIEYTRELGKMSTQSNTAKGKIGEMGQAFTELSLVYKRMTDQEKASPVGQAMAHSIEQLRGRTIEAKKDLDDLNKQLSVNSQVTEAAAGDNMDFGSVLQALGGKLGINSDLIGVLTAGTVGYTAAITAAVAATVSATKAWSDYNAELEKQSQAVTVTTGLKGADAAKLQDGVKALAKVYNVDFREAINAANTLMAQFGVTGEQALSLLKDGMQGMIEGDGGKLLSMIQQYAPSFRDAGIEASQLVAIIQNSEGGLFTDQNMNAIVMGIRNIRHQTKATRDALAGLGIDGEKMSQRLEDGTMTVFEALQEVAGAIDNVRSGSDEAGAVMQAVFGRQGTMAGTKLGEAIKTLNLNLQETKMQTGLVGESMANLVNQNEKLNQALRDTFGYDGWQSMANGIESALVGALAEALTVTNDLRTSFFEISGIDVFSNIISGAANALGPLGSVLDYLRKIAGIGQMMEDNGGLANPDGSYAGGGGIAGVLAKNMLQEVVVTPNTGSGTTTSTKGGKGGTKAASWAPVAMGEQEGLTFGRSVNDVTKEMQSAQSQFNAAGDEMGRAMAKAMIDALKAEKDKMMNEGDVTKGGFGDAYSHDFGKDIKGLESQMKNADNLAKQGQDVRESWQQAAGAIGSVGNALAGLEDPGAKIIGTVGQAIAQIALGFAQATAADSKLGVFGWIAAVAGGLGTMISTISAIKSATGYANGGVVNYNGGGGVIPGNSYNGDNLRMIGVNSGEIIMNTAQQNNVANALLSRQEGGVDVQPWVDGEKIFLGMNNTTRRQGRGEIVTTSMLKSKGIL